MRNLKMIDYTQEDEKFDPIDEYLRNLDNFEKLYEQFILSEIVEEEYRRRQSLRYKARKLMEEYEQMSEEEQEEFEEKRNRDNQYTKEQLEEIADKDDDELIPDEKLDELDIPSRYVSGDMEARSVSEVRKIMAALMRNYDPVDKDAPNWTQTRKELQEEHDIHIYPVKLKRYWSAIEEKEAFSLVKKKLYMDIADKMEDTISNLFEHINNRVGSEGGEYDSMKERVEALERITQIMETVSGDKQKEQQQGQGAAVNQQFVLKDIETANRDDDTETIDIEGEDDE